MSESYIMHWPMRFKISFLTITIGTVIYKPLIHNLSYQGQSQLVCRMNKF
jgi:hypothetical protein